MKIAAVLLSVMFLAGCEDIEGTLKVVNPFQVATKSGVKIVPVGNYETSLDFKRDQVVATLKTDAGKTKATILIPTGTRIPANGEFYIGAADSGQPFAVSGNNTTTETNSQRRIEWETCTYQDFDVICSPQGCSQRPVTRWGNQRTEYYNRTISQDLVMNVMEPAPGVEPVAATFTGYSSRSEKVVVRQDRCF